jgi:hypothetical protein
MRQLIARVEDDLHDRLKARAKADGRPLNAIVIDALEGALRQPSDDRARLRAKLASTGGLVVPPRPERTPSRAAAIAATRGAGSAVSEALAAERATR